MMIRNGLCSITYLNQLIYHTYIIIERNKWNCKETYITIYIKQCKYLITNPNNYSSNYQPNSSVKYINENLNLGNQIYKYK